MKRPLFLLFLYALCAVTLLSACRKAEAPVSAAVSSAPMIALTFDDGPGYNGASDAILDTLEQYRVKATFFMVGEMAENRPKNLRRKRRLGCEIGNHTYRHNHYGTAVTQQDIRQASDAIYAACGVRPTAFRSPGGFSNKAILRECAREQMTEYYWTLDTEDWKCRNAEQIYETVMNHVRDGDIVLLHEIYPSTAQAVAQLVPALLARGYRLVTCAELVEAKSGAPPQSGCQYRDGDTVMNRAP